MRPFGVIVLAMLTSVATTAGSLYGAFRLGYVGAATEANRAVAPSLLGLTETDAKTNLEALGLKLMVAGREPNPEAEEGTVVSQVPKAGDPIGPDGAVRLTLALAVPKVPDVIGKSVEEAKRALEEAGYAVTVAEPKPNEQHAEGIVAVQTPPAGQRLQTKETVTLEPSAGVGVTEIPKLIGLGLDAAKEAAEKAQLELTIQWVALAETPTYVVLRQDPEPGKPAEPGAKVTAFVNR